MKFVLISLKNQAMRASILSLTVISLILSSFLSCSKTVKPKWMSYQETSCLPFWVNESSDKKTKNTLETFLKTEGIIPLKIKIEGNRVNNCEACECATGKIYEVQVDKSQVGHLSYWGFELK